MSNQVIIAEFRPFKRNTLVGFVNFEMPSGVIYRDWTVNRSEGSAWVAPPSKSLVAKDGTPLLGKNNKQIWRRLVDFKDKETERLFSRAVIAALKSAHPEVFDGAETSR
jgi:hypothetical protein